MHLYRANTVSRMRLKSRKLTDAKLSRYSKLWLADDGGDWSTMVAQVRWSFVLQTTADHDGSYCFSLDIASFRTLSALEELHSRQTVYLKIRPTTRMKLYPLLNLSGRAKRVSHSRASRSNCSICRPTRTTIMTK